MERVCCFSPEECPSTKNDSKSSAQNTLTLVVHCSVTSAQLVLWIPQCCGVATTVSMYRGAFKLQLERRWLRRKTRLHDLLSLSNIQWLPFAYIFSELNFLTCLPYKRGSNSQPDLIEMNRTHWLWLAVLEQRTTGLEVKTNPRASTKTQNGEKFCFRYVFILLYVHCKENCLQIEYAQLKRYNRYL